MKYYRWTDLIYKNKLGRRKFNKWEASGKTQHKQLRHETAHGEIQELLMWLGSEERPLTWWKLARLLGMKDPNYIYAWKNKSKRPSGYRIA